jgi:phosphate transport system substrate-binding protein
MVLCALLTSCARNNEETTTKGHLNVLIAESVAPVLVPEINAFTSLYRANGADITFNIFSSEKVNRRFVLDSTRMIVTSKRLTPEEQQSVKKTTENLVEIVLAYDGILAVVHRNNTCKQMAESQIRDILEGKITTWNKLDRKKVPGGTINLILQDSSDVTWYLSQHLLRGNEVRAHHHKTHSPLETLEDVTRDPQSLAFVDLSWLDSARTPVKVLALATDTSLVDTLFKPDPESIGKYFAPHPAHIYLNNYPLKRAIYGYARTTPADLPTGFVSFLASPPGQRIFLDKGLVPGTQKIRLKPSS